MKSSDEELRLAPVIWDWWKIRLPSRGLLATSKEFFTQIWDFVRESTPERHRQRYGDAEFDWDHRVDTTSATVTVWERLVGTFSSAYQPTEPEQFSEMMRRLPISFPEFTFIDLGSGKGRTLMMASDFPFRRIVGVELLPRLHSVAQQNLDRYRRHNGGPFEVEFVCRDARRFEFPLEPLVVYLFNPFLEPVLEAVLANLELSVRQNPRPAYIVYHNPVFEYVLQKVTSFRKMAGLQHCSIYVSST